MNIAQADAILDRVSERDIELELARLDFGNTAN